MQAGLAERQRLQSAFGTYVDPVLAARLLQQGDDVFTGERREVTVMFVDIRDFTPFAEANAAEDAVARSKWRMHFSHLRGGSHNGTVVRNLK
jgi:adenylate cyclase